LVTVDVPRGYRRHPSNEAWQERCRTGGWESGRGEKTRRVPRRPKDSTSGKICRLEALTSFISPATKKTHGGSSREKKLYESTTYPKSLAARMSPEANSVSLD